MGRLGHGSDETLFSPRAVTAGGLDLPQNRVVDVALGWDHTLVLTGRGQVWSFGANQYGQLGYGAVGDAAAAAMAGLGSPTAASPSSAAFGSQSLAAQQHQHTSTTARSKVAH